VKPMSLQRVLLDGVAGKLETVINDPGVDDPAARRGIALIAHPHPLFGGTLDNKVAQTLARTFHDLGCVAIRPNFRGVGQSEGAHDEGRGEADDLAHLADWAKETYGPLPLFLAGFSFGGFVQLKVARRKVFERLVLVAPAVTRVEEEEPPLPSNTLVVHGEQDDVVSLQSILDWARPKELPIVLLPGAGHFFHGRLHQLREIICNACKF
jgi:alpha/beta superfamily hydrolase